MNNDMMMAFNALIGVYALYSAIVGKGSAYKNDYPEPMKTEANAMLRKYLWIIGPTLLVFTALEYFYPYFPIFGPNGSQYFFWAMFAIIIVLVVTYIVTFRRTFKEYLKKSKKK